MGRLSACDYGIQAMFGLELRAIVCPLSPPVFLLLHPPPPPPNSPSLPMSAKGLKRVERNVIKQASLWFQIGGAVLYPETGMYTYKCAQACDKSERERDDISSCWWKRWLH